MTVSEDLSKLEEIFKNCNYEIVEIVLDKENGEKLKKEVEKLTDTTIDTSITSFNGMKILVADNEQLKDKAYLIAIKPKENTEENE